MKKKILSVVSGLALAMTFSAGMTANAYSWQSDYGEYAYDHKSDKLDWCLWEDFLKYDLRITDFDSLDSEKQELCKYIYETEMMSKETIVCERARRIVAGEDVGERLTLEKLQQYEYLGDYKWLYGDGGIDVKNYNDEDQTYELYYKYKDKLTLFCIPDIKHMEQAYNEYWLDDDGAEFIEAKGEGIGFTPDIRGFTHVDSDGNREWYRFSGALEYRTIKSDGLYYKEYPDNTLCFTGADYDYILSPYYHNEYIAIPDKVNGMPVTRIASGAFKDCPVETIHFSANLEYIEPFAFDNCYNLENVHLPENIKCIAPYAFNECHKLFHLVINCPSADISASSFYKCDIKSISINAKSVPYFKDCSEINQVTILNGVEELDVNYLTDGTKIPESVRIISGYIHYGNNTDITVPEHIEILGAFPDIPVMYFGSGISYNPRVPLLDETYNIFKDHKDKGTISGYSGTEAENYAKKHKIKFIPLNDVPKEDDGTVSGYYGSDEHIYALENNLQFNPLDDIEFGDTNRDGEVNVADVVLLQQYLYDSENYMVSFEADVNKDGYVDIFDMVQLRKMLVK